MAVPSGAAYNVDWILASVADAHVANHCDWFVDLTPFETIVSGCPVKGIGTVLLPLAPVKRSARSELLRLDDVLYAPDYEYNVLCQSKSGFTTINFFSSVAAKDGKDFAIIDKPRKLRLRLLGQSKSFTSLRKDVEYLVRAQWDVTEQTKWQAHKRSLAAPNVKPSKGKQTNGATANDADSSCPETIPPYSIEEKMWLKKNYENEFKFLLSQGLSMCREEDRAEGRETVRALILDGDDNDDDEDEGEDDEIRDSENDDYCDFEAELETDFASHAADYAFSDTELNFIKKEFGDATQFLYSYGLKFDDKEDCNRGKSLVQGLMGPIDIGLVSHSLGHYGD